MCDMLRDPEENLHHFSVFLTVYNVAAFLNLTLRYQTTSSSREGFEREAKQAPTVTITREMCAALGSKTQLINAPVTFSKLSKSLCNLKKKATERRRGIRNVGKRKQ